MTTAHEVAVWFPAVRTQTGTDVFTERLAERLARRGIRAEVTWLPLRAEFAPWSVPVPTPPEWATVAHVNTWLPVRFLPRRLPIVATIHHSVHHPDARAYKGLARATYHRGWIAPNERRVLRRADRIVAVSEFVARTTRHTLLDMPMEVVYNGIDTHRFTPVPRQRMPGQRFQLLYAGSWMARKGVDLLAPIMRGLGEQFELRYTGGGSVARTKADMPSNMHDVGRLDANAVIAALHAADALLFPSRSEGLPLVAIEAMACGLPVIATNGTALSEVVEDGITGVLCREGDIAAFVEAVRWLAGSPQVHAQMSAAARARAAGVFAIDDMLDGYIRVYREAVARERHSDVPA